MANSFNLDLGNLAQVSARLVGLDFNLASLISSDVEADFTPGKGATISVNVPGAIPTHTKGIFDKTTALIADDISEQKIDVTLSDHVYSLTALSAGDYSLNIADFSRQVVSPQARAIAAKIEALTATALQATPAGTGFTYSAANPAKALTEARKRLRANGVGDNARLVAAVGSSFYADLLDAPATSGMGFDASGKVRGFEVIESTRLAPTAIVAFIPEAFSLVVRAPMVPNGAAYGASVRTPILDADNGKAFALTHVIDYDSGVAADRSLLSTFVKVQAMPLPKDNEDGTVTLVANGGAVRLAAA